MQSRRALLAELRASLALNQCPDPDPADTPRLAPSNPSGPAPAVASPVAGHSYSSGEVETASRLLRCAREVIRVIRVVRVVRVIRVIRVIRPSWMNETDRQI